MAAEKPAPRSRGQLQDLVIAALGADSARADYLSRKPTGLTTLEVTRAVNTAAPGPDVSRKVVLTILKRLRRDGRVWRDQRGGKYLYKLTRDPERLSRAVHRIEVEYGAEARIKFGQRAKHPDDAD